MKRYCTPLTLLLVMAFASVSAQDENFLGLGLGAAFPQGSFTERDFSNENAGYANTGFLFTFDGAIFPDEYLGIGATVTYGSNNTEKEQYKADLLDNLKNQYPDFSEVLDSVGFSFGSWRYLNFHAGPAFTVPIGRLNIDLRVLAGLSLVWLPEEQIRIKWETGQTFSRNVVNKAIPTVGFTAGAGIRYALRSGYVLRFITEYTNAKPTYEARENLIISPGGDSELTTRDVEIPLKNIHVGIGIAYNFEI